MYKVVIIKKKSNQKLEIGISKLKKIYILNLNIKKVGGS